MNPAWIQTTVASVILAIALRVLFGIPFFLTMTVVAAIFTAAIVRNNLGGGVSTVWEWIKARKNFVKGLGMYVVLRYLTAMVIGFYPATAYKLIKSNSGLYGALKTEDMVVGIMFEIVFAVGVGKVMVDWVEEKGYKWQINTIIATALVVLGLALGFKETTKTVPTRSEIDQAIAKEDVFRKAGRGIVGAVKSALETKPAPVVTKPVANNTPVPAMPVVAPQVRNTPAPQTAPVEDPLFPTSGNGVAKKGIGIQAYLDPMKTSTKASGPTIYMLESNPAVQVEDHGVGDLVDERALAIWRTMKPGRYVVYPIGDDDITFRWWK